MAKKTVIGEIERVLPAYDTKIIFDRGTQEMFLVVLKDHRKFTMTARDVDLVRDRESFTGSYQEAEDGCRSHKCGDWYPLLLVEGLGEPKSLRDFHPIETAEGRCGEVGCPKPGGVIDYIETEPSAVKLTTDEIALSSVALRFDEGKTRFDLLDPRWIEMLARIVTDSPGIRLDLIPRSAIEELAKVYTEGAKKYCDDNWRKGMNWSRCIAALGRHWNKWLRGERFDVELGLEHLSQVAWNAFTLLEYQKTHSELDNREKSRMDMGDGR